jgi:ParB family transcriptional regulator, chromosome partitioning protein
MSKNKRGLGRGLGDLGLGALLGDLQNDTTAVATPSLSRPSAQPEDPSAAKLREIPVDKIRPGRYQPRKTMDPNALKELAESIRSQGIIQPIVLRRMNEGYEIIAGERRWRAAQQAGLQAVPAIVRDIPDSAAIAMALIENIQRQDLNAIEEAAALQRLIMEFQLTHDEVAKAIGKSRTLVTNLLRLLKLNPDVRALVEKGRLDMGHARALLALSGIQQSDAANEIMARGLSVRQTEAMVRGLQETKTSQAPAGRPDPNITRLESQLSEKLGAKVVVRHDNKGKGKLIVHYYSLDELDGLLEKMG